MQHDPTSWGGEQVSPPPPKSFTLVQHNCLGSWDVFLSLFGSFTQLTQPPSIVALQDISKNNTLRPMRPVRLTHLTPER